MDDEKELNMGEFIRKRRMELGLSQEELGDRLDPPASQSQVSAMELRRINLPPPQRVRQLAAALEVDPIELLERSGWTGAAGEAVRLSLAEANGYSARNNWEAELLEWLPRLNAHDIRVLLALVKRMAPAEGARSTRRK